MKLIYTGDFERLKDFGFEFFENGCGTTGYSFFDKDKGYVIIVEKDREDYNKYGDERKIPKNIPHDLLYDLIKAGLVKKEEE